MEQATEQVRVSPQAKSLIYEEKREGDTFSDTIVRVFEFYQLDYLVQLGTLSKALLQMREVTQEKDRQLLVLKSVPSKNSHTGSAVSINQYLTVQVVAGEQSWELAGKEEHHSNYAHEGSSLGTFGSEILQALADQTVLVQLAYLIQQHNLEKVTVAAQFLNRDYVQGRDYSEEDESWEIEFDFP